MKTYFREEWLANVKYKLWVAKTKEKTVARCTLCKSDISLANMGSSALDVHAGGKKHSFRHPVRVLILVLRNQQQLRRRKEIHLKI